MNATPDPVRVRPAARRYDVAAAILFALVSLHYGIAAVALASDAPVWMDEVLAIRTARLVDPAAIWAALMRGAEFTPPLYDLLLGRMVAAGMDSPLALRLPSIVAVYVAALAIGSIAWRRAGPVQAALAGGVILSSGLFTIAVQARPYAVLTAAFALALAIRDHPTGARLSPLRCALLALCLVTMVALHFYALLLVATLALIELGTACAAGKKPSPGVLAAVAVAGMSVLPWWPVMTAARAYSVADTAAPAYYGRPTGDALLIGYAVAIGWLVVPTLLLLIAVAMTRPRGKALPLDALALLAIPVIVFVFAVFVSHSYAPRYVAAAALGLALLVVALIERLGDRARPAALLLLVMLPIGNATWRWGGDIADPDRRAAIAAVTRVPGSLPIVTGSGLRFLELAENVPPAIRRRLLYVAVPGMTWPDPTNHHQVLRWKAIDPATRIVDARTLLASRPAFWAFAQPGPAGVDPLPEWLAHHAGVARAPANRVTLTLVRPQHRGPGRIVPAEGR